MYCLTNMCYVCLEKKDKSLININRTLSVNMDIIHIISDLPFNLGWLKTNRIILICEECCRRLRETYQLLTMCLKNSAVLQGYMAKINTANISGTDNAAELRIALNNKDNDIDWIKCEIKEEEQFESEPIIEETENVCVNVDVALVKEEDTWKKEAVDDEEEPAKDNNASESSDKETDTKIAVNSNNTHATNTDFDSFESASTQVHTTNKNELNAVAKKSHKCLTCGKSFSAESILDRHTRLHTGEKPYECAICKKCFTRQFNVVQHMRIHTGEKPYECSSCKKSFRERVSLVRHMRIHTGEKPYKCSNCNECYRLKSHLDCHMQIHTGKKLYKCSSCEKGFSQNSTLRRHMRMHTGEKPYECSKCKKCFSQGSSLVFHMRTHTGEKPFECTSCKKCFRDNSNLTSHMRTHTG